MVRDGNPEPVSSLRGEGSIIDSMIRLIKSLVCTYISYESHFPPISSYVGADKTERQQYCSARTIVGFTL